MFLGSGSAHDGMAELSAFRQTGLIPFNPDILLSKLPKQKLEHK